MKDASLKSFFFLQLVSPNYKDWLVPYLREFFISQYKTGFSIKSSNNNLISLVYSSKFVRYQNFGPSSDF